MSYIKKFPEVLKSTYKNCIDISTSDLPKVKLRSYFWGIKTISLPFLDTIRVDGADKKDFEGHDNFEIRLSESNKNLPNIRKELIAGGFKENAVKGHIISELTNEEDYWKRFHKHTRNDIRKAEKSGLKLKRIEDENELKRFYSLYLKEMRNFGTPQHSFRFFENCFKIMEGDFFGLNCYKDKFLAASIIAFIDEDYCYISFNVSDGEFRNLRPNDLLYWETIKWAMKNKKKFLDIGQVDLSPETGTRMHDLLRFKQKWLGKEYRKIYFTRGFKYDEKKKDKLRSLRSAWRKLPLFVIKMIGPKICSMLG